MALPARLFDPDPSVLSCILPQDMVSILAVWLSLETSKESYVSEALGDERL